MSFCEILHLFSQVLIRNFLWCYYRWLITFIALEKCEKNVILFKLFWYNVFFHWKLRLLNFVMDSVLCVMLYFSVNAFRWRIHSDHVIVTRFIGAVVLARFASLLRSYARVRMCFAPVSVPYLRMLFFNSLAVRSPPLLPPPYPSGWTPMWKERKCSSPR